MAGAGAWGTGTTSMLKTSSVAEEVPIKGTDSSSSALPPQKYWIKNSSAPPSEVRSTTSVEHWSSAVVEAVVCVQGDSAITVLGGSDNGQFPYLGEISGNVKYDKGGPSLAPGALLLEIQGQRVSGYTQRDVVAWLNHCTRNGNPCVIRTAPPGKLRKRTLKPKISILTTYYPMGKQKNWTSLMLLSCLLPMHEFLNVYSKLYNLRRVMVAD